tara:strand:+ start:133 stop:249 length:117 start_codon:yes stop_codon:yes gene_type:complete
MPEKEYTNEAYYDEAFVGYRNESENEENRRQDDYQNNR